MTISAVCASTTRFQPSRSTGKERDTESGNDYFEARYYSSSMGRFMSPDWSARVEPVPYAKLGDPQSLNLYAYVSNHPLSLVDPDGHAPLSWGGFESCGSENAQPGCGGNPIANSQKAMDAQANTQAQKAQEQKKMRTTANVVYNETGGFANGPGLHDGRVAEATVFDHHPNAFPKNERSLTKLQEKQIATDPHARAVMEDSWSAANEAVGRPDIGGHAITWDPTANIPHVPWMNSAYVTQTDGRFNIFGPLLNKAGGGAVPKGDWTYIVIMQDVPYRER